MDRRHYEMELREFKEMYAKVERMSEAKAQEFMNSDDSKNTILMYIQEEMDEIEEKLEEMDREDYGGYEVDEAFRSWADFYSMVA